MIRQLKEIDLHLTNRCNLKCKICCFDSNNKILPELKTNTILKLLKDAYCLGCRDVHITGGEPLLRIDLTEIIREALKLNLQVRLQTNGLLLSKERADDLKRNGLRNIMISIDSSNKMRNDFIRGRGAYDAALNAISVAMTAGFNVRVNSVLNLKTIDDFIPLALMVAKQGVRKISAFYFSPIGRGKEYMNLWIPPEEYYNKIEKIKGMVNKLRCTDLPTEMDIILENAYTSWESSRYLDNSEFTGCGAGCQYIKTKRDYIIIRCDGKVFPCILTINWIKKIGDINTQTLNEIWNDNSAWDMLERSHLKRQCNNCERWDLCYGGCAGYAEIFSDDFREKDNRCVKGKLVPLCPIMKYNIKRNRYGGSSDSV